jgi:hypothetical protein
MVFFIICKNRFMKKILLLALVLSLGIPAVTGAQTKVKEKGHFVKMKPKKPKYAKAVAPSTSTTSTSYTYINEDWTWDDGTGTWTWNGNRWAEPPAAGQHWVPGHWSNTGMGWEWTAGYWK